MSGGGQGVPPGGPREDAEESTNRRGALIALAVVVVLVIGGIFLSQILHGVSQIQDCAMQGRRNCAPIQSSGG
ncbi:MAG TPA: hypothetical protein VHS58_07685 [Acetobacteraceae bacterium]|jgi:hypothetical protein|nr:hypothetical protein [Acetobacteraceae bacterium]